MSSSGELNKGLVYTVGGVETPDERRWDEEKRRWGLVGAEGHPIVRYSANQSIPMNLVTYIAQEKESVSYVVYMFMVLYLGWSLTFTHTLVSVNTFWCQRFVTSIVDGDARRCKPQKLQKHLIVRLSNNKAGLGFCEPK